MRSGLLVCALVTVTIAAAAGCGGGGSAASAGSSGPGGDASSLRTPRAGDAAASPTQASKPPAAPEAAPTEVVVYFTDRATGALVGVQRPVDPGVLPVEAALQALLQGPAPGEALSPTMPAGTRLLSLSISGGTANVNLSEEFRSRHPGGSAAEVATLYALTNTLTHFPFVSRVVIWLEGRRLDAYLHLDLSDPLTRRADLIQIPASSALQYNNRG